MVKIKRGRNSSSPKPVILAAEQKPLSADVIMAAKRKIYREKR
jgi:hypothetical protein